MPICVAPITMSGVEMMGYFIDKYGDDLTAFGLGYIATSPHGRAMIRDLAKSAVLYRVDQAKIIGRFAGREAVIRAGALRGPAQAAVAGATRGLFSVAKHPATLVLAGGYIAGTAVGNTQVVQTRGDPNPLLMGVF